MNLLQYLLLFGFVALVSSQNSSYHLSPECAKGIGFWCQHIVNAKKCNAVDFCISAVWNTHFVEPDSDLICNDCKDWVNKARNFVENGDKSGEIVKSLKWTCDQIPLESLQSTCKKIIDENVPEILKMLESSMDPESICSKLFFCNNARFDELLEQHKKEKLLPFTCGQCHVVTSIVEKKFLRSDRDEFLEGLLSVCGELSSYSDSCSTLVMMNFEDIYNAVKKNIDSDWICSKSGACLHQQLQGIVDILPASDVDEDIPCQLCEQLVLHLRELLINNTTNIEFKKILEGFCHQMGKFSTECIEVSDQYYLIIYNYLLDKLSANSACILAGICPSQERVPKMPLIPLVSAEIYPAPQEKQVAKLIKVEIEFSDSSLILFKNGTFCTTCEYFIHFLQQALSKQSTQDDIVAAMKKTCKQLPQKIQEECNDLIELYGDSIMSFLDQDLDARYICPKIKLCPPNLNLKYLEQTAISEKPTCPFCLLALQEVSDIIASNKTKQNIKNVMSKLCNHLSDKLLSQCTEFVSKYSDEVVEMILADFTPQEACTFMKLCENSEHTSEHRNLKTVETDLDFLDADEERETLKNPQCEMCKEIVTIVEQRVINKKSKKEIQHELEDACSRLKKFSDKCKQFVDKYSDQIIDLIESELEPQEICHELTFCVNIDEADTQDYDSALDILLQATKEVDNSIKDQPQCVICEFIMTKLENELNDKKTDEEIKSTVKNICSKLPSTVAKSCKQFVDYYFDMIIVLIETMKPSEICGEMKLCPALSYDIMMIEGIQHDIYKCAICKGLVEGIDAIVEDPYTDTNLENLEEKLCEKFALKFKPKCHDLVQTYGLVIINLLKNLTDSDQICYKLDLCSWSGEHGTTGMVKLT